MDHSLYTNKVKNKFFLKTFLLNKKPQSLPNPDFYQNQKNYMDNLYQIITRNINFTLLHTYYNS